MKRITKSKGWRNRSVDDPQSTESIARELDSRVLDSLDRCQVAWEHADDPLALATAVTLVKMPAWLSDALIFALTLDSDGSQPKLPALWRDRFRDMRDCHRASAVASARVVGKPLDITWDMSLLVSQALPPARFDDIGHCGPAAMKKAFHEVSKGIQNPGRYHRPPHGFQARMIAALDRQIARIQTRLQKQRNK